MKDSLVHVDFGLYRFPEGKMSTRKGKVIFMDDVLSKAIELAQKNIEEKNPSLENKKETAEKVGIGAIIFSDLSTDRVKDVVFDWDKILSFEGETGPYIQYSYVRINSIFRKGGVYDKKKLDFSKLKEKEEQDLIKQLSLFEQTIDKVAETYKPHSLTRYLLDLAAKFNEFYHACPVIKADTDELKNARLALIDATRIILKNGLNLLGIEAPEKM